MIKLEIVKIDNYLYRLEDSNHNNYTAHLEFYDLNKPLSIGDSIYISDELINELSIIPLRFGPLTGIYGREITSEDDKDLIIIKYNAGAVCYLKRYYG